MYDMLMAPSNYCCRNRRPHGRAAPLEYRGGQRLAVKFGAEEGARFCPAIGAHWVDGDNVEERFVSRKTFGFALQPRQNCAEILPMPREAS